MEAFGSKQTRSRTHTMDRFFADAAKGTLPALTWIDPRQGINKTLGNLGGPNSDHPSCCDVALGERLRKDVYEALRAGPGWNETAFIMTWDDPGGFFDHARPRVLDAPLRHLHAVAATYNSPADARAGAAADGRPAARPPGRLLLPQRREDVRGLRALLAARESSARARGESVGPEGLCGLNTAHEAVAHVAVRRDVDRSHGQAIV